MPVREVLPLVTFGGGPQLSALLCPVLAIRAGVALGDNVRTT